MRRKGSLSLSVNAIVVFVLAFAMLGVGLVFVNMIKDKFLDSGEDIIDINELKNPPSSSDPLTVKSEIRLAKRNNLKLEVGYYNTMNNMAKSATIGISQCLYEDDSGDSYYQDDILDHLKVISPSIDVPASEGRGFKIIIREEGDGLVNGLYVCKMVVYNKDEATDVEGIQFSESDPADSYLYYEKEFFLEVVS